MAATLAAVAALGTWGADGTGDSEGAATGLRIMVPNNPGGGYDVTARTSVAAMRDAGHAVEVFNLPGAGGTVGLGRLVAEKGNGKLAMQMGQGVVGSVCAHSSRVTLADTTPIALLLEEPDIIVVPDDSPYTELGQLIEDWKAAPDDIVVGGGSSPGGPDHLASMLMAQAVGLEPRRVEYAPFDGGGPLLASVLSAKVTFGMSGVSEHIDQVRAGRLRVLAVTGPERLESVNAPTLREAGVDVEVRNWRGVVAPPGISDAERQELVDVYTEMHRSRQWRAALRRNGWHDTFLAGDEFGVFIRRQTERVESVLGRIGLPCEESRAVRTQV
ncbi:tripartite tricarboxylate transporter substrate-binding protein [Streptomyces sp. NPDC006172]|uniref:Bug family tripartite tricarboxylate transporter substrate binding protein n=1 Tax=Streptomyces sp. NPDC006172 TaxID=3154470 RepID=UPI0034080931